MGNQCLPRQKNLQTQFKSLQVEVERLSKDKTALEFQLAELRARYSHLLSEDISNSYQSICVTGLKGGPVLERSFYYRVKGGQGTQPRANKLTHQSTATPDLQSDVERFPGGEYMGTFPRSRVNHRAVEENIYQSQVGDAVEDGGREVMEAQDVFIQLHEDRGWSWRRAGLL